MDILDIFWTFYLNHLSPLWGYFSTMSYTCGTWSVCLDLHPPHLENSTTVELHNSPPPEKTFTDKIMGIKKYKMIQPPTMTLLQ